MPDTAETARAGREPAPVAAGRSLSADVVLTFGSKIVFIAVGVAAGIIVARTLGPSGRGVLAVASALVLTLTQLGTLGLVAANPYFLARERTPTSRLVTNSLWFSAGLGVLLIGIGVLFKVGFPGATHGLGWTEAAVALAAIPAMLAAQLLQGLLLGEGRMVAYNSVDLSNSVIVLGVLSVGLLALGFGVLQVLIVITLAAYLSSLLAIVLLRAHLRLDPRPHPQLAWAMLRYGLRIYIATVLAFLVIRLDVFLVNGYLGTEQAGIYSVVANLAEMMYLLPTVVGLNLFPRVARGASVEFTASVFRIMAVLYGGLCLVTIPLIAPGIRILYGPQFADAVGLYYWILPGVFSLGMLTILSNHFAGRGFPLEAAVIWVGGLALNIAINLAFLPRFGTYIASLASTIAYSLLLLLHIRLFAREAGGYRVLSPSVREAAAFLRGRLSGLGAG
jgi:O-antigen/teichoic acid export membrane protein